MKKFIGLGASALIFTLLVVGCATESRFTNFEARNARSINTSYDMLLVSNDDTISKVYKLTRKPDGRVFYAISEIDGGDDDINAEELNDFVVITKENANDLIAFINQVEAAYQKGERNGTDGVLYDIAVVRDYTYTAMTVDSITDVSQYSSMNSSAYSYSGSTGSNVRGYGNTNQYGSEYTSGSAVSSSVKEFKEEDELVRIQLKTVENEDVIIFAVAGFAEEVEVEDLKTLRDALSK